MPHAAAEKKSLRVEKNHPTDSRLEVATRKATKRARGADKVRLLEQCVGTNNLELFYTFIRLIIFKSGQYMYNKVVFTLGEANAIQTMDSHVYMYLCTFSTSVNTLYGIIFSHLIQQKLQ